MSINKPKKNNKEDNHKNDWKAVKKGILFIFIGIFIITIILYLKNANNNFYDLKALTVDLILKICIAFITVGIIGIIIEFKDWKVYFQSRLQDIILENEYLKKLSDYQLISLQISTLKAYFKNDNIDREGSFLYFYQNKIQKYISCPYREDFNFEIIISNPLNVNYLKLKETITYTCRASKGRIQEDVTWATLKDDVLSYQSIEIKIKKPNDTRNNIFTFRRDLTTTPFDEINDQIIYKEEDNYQIFLLKLDDYILFDRLEVVINL